jgi:formylglycine-generating enzyme required for sulfatase activity
MKMHFLAPLAVLACSSSVVAQSPFPLPVPQRPTLPLPIPARPDQPGFLYLNVASAAMPGTVPTTTLSIPSALPPAMQGNIVAATVSLEVASSTANGGWALSSDGQVGSIVTSSSGGAGPSSGQISIISTIEEAVAVAGPSLSKRVVAIKADGGVVAAMDSSAAEVPPEATDLRTIGYVNGFFFGLGADGRFVAWTYSDTWPPRPSAPAVIATNWTVNKPFMVQTEMTFGMYGQRLVGLTGAGEIKAWDEQGNQVAVPQDGNNDISFFRVSPDNSMLQTLAAVRSDGGVFLARLGQSEPLALPQGLSAVAEIHIIPGYAEVAVAVQADGIVKVWKVDSGEELPLPPQASSAIGISANGNLTRPDGSVLQLRYVQTDPMNPSSGSITASLMQAGVVASGPNYVISRDPSLILGFPLSVLARLVAEEILTHTNNYGLATKPDLLGAVQDALVSGEQQGIATVQAAPNTYNLYSADQFQASYSQGVTAGTSLVTANPGGYNLYTSDSIMDLRMGGLMLQKQGTSATVFFQPQTTTDLASIPFADNGLPVSKTFEMPENKHFLRIQALAAAPDQMITVEAGTLPQSSQLAGTVVETFRIGKYEVTWGEWHSVKAWATSRGYDFDTWDVPDPDTYPVRRISWNDAAKFCNAKSEMEQLQPVYQANGETYKAGWADPTVNQTANGYRLPSEAEWEWAARGGVNSMSYAYSGGSDIDKVAWYSDNHAGLGPRPGGQKAANELGIHDMSGNLYEFTQDPVIGGSFRRSRGGSWFAGAEHSRVVDRFDFPDYGFGHIGFRLARNAP